MTETPPNWATDVPSTSGVHPSATEDTAWTRPDFLFRLPTFALQFIEKIIGLVVQALTGGLIGGGFGSAFGQLANWADVLLPAQIREPLGQLVDLLVTVLDSIPIIGPPIGDAVEDLAALFGLMNDNTEVAQSTGDVALSETALIKAQLDGLIIGGAGFSETFDGAQETTLSGYTHVNFGGSGTYGRKDGYGHWFTAFSISQTILLVKDTDVLTSSTQRCAMKIKTRVLHSDRAVWLLARLDATGDDCCFVKVGPNNISYGYMISGSITTMDTVSPGSTSSGELWEFEVGAPGQPAGTNDWLWVVRRNGSTILNVVDDPTQPTLLDTSHRSIGFAASARNEFGAQVPPPDIEVITWVDI